MPDYLTTLLQRPSLGWWDLLDIAIVSILIYEFLKLIRGTRAVQMAVGSLLTAAALALPGLAMLAGRLWLTSKGKRLRPEGGAGGKRA